MNTPKNPKDTINIIMPRYVTEEEAEEMGAFEEDALSYEDAIDSIEDTSIGDDGESDDDEEE